MSLTQRMTSLYTGRSGRTGYLLQLPVALIIGILASIPPVVLPVHYVRLSYADGDPRANLPLALLGAFVTAVVLTAVSVPIVRRLNDIGWRARVAAIPLAALPVGLLALREWRLHGSTWVLASAIVGLGVAAALFMALLVRPGESGGDDLR